MRIVQINLYQVAIPFRFSFKHAEAERNCAENIIIEVRTEKGAVGYGEAIPREYLTGETLESIWEDITEYWVHKVMDIEFRFSEPIHQQLLPLYHEASSLGKTASYSALDVAIHSAAAYTRALSIAGMIGCPQNSPALTAPLGGSSVASVRKKTMLFKYLQFKDFKLKTGLGEDIAKVAAARKIIGNKYPLRVDSNQGWSLCEATKLIPELQQYGVTEFEEPVQSIEEMALLQKTTGIDIIADEKICTYEDAQRLLKLKAANIWNLRLAKNGGYTGVIELIKLAEANNIKLTLGVLVGESSVLSEAALAITGLTEFCHTEYGFSKILLKKDPFMNATSGYFGKPRTFHGRSGLGLFFQRKKIKHFKKRETSLNNGVFTPPKYQKKNILTEMSFFRK